MSKCSLLLVVLALAGANSFADETLGEKVGAGAHNVKRSVKKSAHRASEAACAEGDAKCLAKKGKHRVEEGSDYVKDKSTEVKNKVD